MHPSQKLQAKHDNATIFPMLSNILNLLGWAMPVPAVPLLLCFHIVCGTVHPNEVSSETDNKQTGSSESASFSVDVWIVWVVTFLFFFSNQGLHWYTSHHQAPNHVNTWRSLLRSFCALSLSFSVLIRITECIFKHIFPSFYPVILTSVLSGITCSLNQFWYQSTLFNIVLGLWNWAALIFMIWAHVSMDNSNNAGEEIRLSEHYFISMDSKLFLLICAIDLLSAPYQRYQHSNHILHLWSFIWTMMFPILYTIITGGANDNSPFLWNVQYIVNSANATVWLVLMVPCILYSQRCYFWNWTLPALRNEKAKYETTSVHLVFVVIVIVTASLHATFYVEIERILLVAHFVLHWLAHIANVYSIESSSQHSKP